MPSSVQTPIRLQINPNAAPIDANTLATPEAWRSTDTAIQIGIFDQNNVAVNLSTLLQLQVVLQATQGATTPLAVITIPAVSISSSLSYADWLSGSAQQAEADFTAGQMDQSLAGATSANLWLAVIGSTATQQIVFGAGPITLQLPAAAVPIPPPTGIVSEHAQSSTSGNLTVTPTSQMHTEAIAVSGAGGSRAFLINPAGIVAGARCTLALTGLAAAIGIIITVYIGSQSGAVLSVIATDGLMQNSCHEYYFNGAQWTLLRSQIPAQ